MPPKIAVRVEQPADAAQVREINHHAFGGPLEARIVDALRAAPGSLSLVATADDEIVGHIFFTRVEIRDPSGATVAAGLGPMAVRPSYQRQGVGSELIVAGLDACRRFGYDLVVVVGHPEYYPRFGFIPARAKGIDCEFQVPDEVFMVRELRPGALAGHRGIVRYPLEFSAE